MHPATTSDLSIEFTRSGYHEQPTATQVLDQVESSHRLALDLTANYLDWSDFYEPDAHVSACITASPSHEPIELFAQLSELL